MSYKRSAITRKIVYEVWAINIYNVADDETRVFEIPIIEKHTEDEALRHFRRALDTEKYKILDVRLKSREVKTKSMSIAKFAALADDISNNAILGGLQ